MSAGKAQITYNATDGRDTVTHTSVIVSTVGQISINTEDIEPLSNVVREGHSISVAKLNFRTAEGQAFSTMRDSNGQPLHQVHFDCEYVPIDLFQLLTCWLG